MGLDFPEGEEEALAADFEAELAKYLTEASFMIIDSNEFKQRAERIKKDIGPVFDPNTGDPIEDRVKAIANYTVREYLAAYNIDAFVDPSIYIVSANWYSNQAAWDGIEEPTTGKEGFWANLTAPDAYGTIPAISFGIEISNVYGDLRYFKRGGIELCNHVKGTSFVTVPEYELLQDLEKNHKAVKLACEPLLEMARTKHSK